MIAEITEYILKSSGRKKPLQDGEIEKIKAYFTKLCPGSIAKSCIWIYEVTFQYMYENGKDHKPLHAFNISNWTHCPWCGEKLIDYKEGINANPKD